MAQEDKATAQVHAGFVKAPPQPAASVGSGSRLARGYLSGRYMWAASFFGARARDLENETPQRPQQDDEHEANVIASILNSALFLEATVNEWLDDANDGDMSGHIASLAPHQRQMSDYWKIAKGQGRVLNKYEELYRLAGKVPLSKGEQPWQGVKALVTVRNELVHRLPATDGVHQIEKALRGKFLDNKLMAGDSAHPWWPYHCLGSGCAKYCYDASVVFAERVADDLGIVPKYRSGMANYRT